jgi:oxygen-independent coproporphyrinogen-3 oxidase
MCSFFEKNGFNHYEISNFSKNGFESRHNLKYWQGTEYLGIGPAAHSFLDRKRFYYPRDLKGFITGNSPLPDGEGGTAEEYIMLKLRLKNGISFEEYRQRFGKELPQTLLNECDTLQKAKLLKITDKNIYLTNEGMLLSNSIISKLLECIE